MKERSAVTERFGRGRSSSRPGSGVLHVITGTARRGAEVFAQDLAEELAARGRDVRTVALARDAYGTEPTIPTLGPSRLSPRTLIALRREARRSRVVVSHGSTAVVATAIATVGTGVPFVYRNIGDTAHWLDTAAKRRRVRWIVRRSAAVVALWEASAAELRVIAGDGAAVEIIPTGTPATTFTPIEGDERNAARAELGVGPGEVVAAYVGALSPEKNVGVAIDAIATLPGARLMIVGDGPARVELERRAAAAAPGRIAFLGALEAPRRALAAADVVVLTSDTEGIPAALIEAAFCELPVVATDVGGVAEVVAHTETGLLVPKGTAPDLLARAISAAAKDRTRMGKAARTRCLERFEIGRVADRWDAMLEGLGAWDGSR